MSQKIRKQQAEGSNPPAGSPSPTASGLVSTLFVEAITWWLEQGRPYTPKEIAKRTSLLAAALFKEAGTWP
jgi:hypothetical protein